MPQRTGESSPRTLWPRGTLKLREPRLAQASNNFTRNFKPPRVGVVAPIHTAIRPAFAQKPKLVPLASLIRPRRKPL